MSNFEKEDEEERRAKDEFRRKFVQKSAAFGSGGSGTYAKQTKPTPDLNQPQHQPNVLDTASDRKNTHRTSQEHPNVGFHIPPPSYPTSNMVADSHATAKGDQKDTKKSSTIEDWENLSKKWRREI